MTTRQGTLALVGAGEFLDSMRPVDAALLERAGGNRVAILPTASAPDGPDVPQRWAEMGVRHFAGMGAQAEAVMALDRDGCDDAANVDAVRRSNLVYFSGGKPDYLLATLEGTSLWAAVLEVLGQGGVLAGCSAGAMILGGWIPARPAAGSLSIWRPAFGLVPDAVILPHFDEIPRWITTPLGWLRPRRSIFVGVDGGTALIGRSTGPAGDQVWEVKGRSRVVVKGRGRVADYGAGETFGLADLRG
jgi:cyanophycinase